MTGSCGFLWKLCLTLSPTACKQLECRLAMSYIVPYCENLSHQRKRGKGGESFVRLSCVSRCRARREVIVSCDSMRKKAPVRSRLLPFLLETFWERMEFSGKCEAKGVLKESVWLSPARTMRYSLTQDISWETAPWMSLRRVAVSITVMVACYSCCIPCVSKCHAVCKCSK